MYQYRRRSRPRRTVLGRRCARVVHVKEHMTTYSYHSLCPLLQSIDPIDYIAVPHGGTADATPATHAVV